MHNTLESYYQEIRLQDELWNHWAELGHARLRLLFSVEELERAMKDLKDLQSIYRVHGWLQTYYACTYEFRERLYTFLAALTMKGSSKTLKECKDEKKRKSFKKALSDLSLIAEESVAPLENILATLKSDVKARNMNTHEAFVRLRFNEGFRWIDVEDIWWEYEEDATRLQIMLKDVSAQGLHLVGEFKLKQHIDENLNVFLGVLMPHL